MQKDPSIDVVVVVVVVVVDRKSTRKRRRRRRRTKKMDNDIFPLLSSSWRRRRPLKRDQHHRRERSASRIARGRDAFFFSSFFFFKREERRDEARKTFHATFSHFLPHTTRTTSTLSWPERAKKNRQKWIRRAVARKCFNSNPHSKYQKNFPYKIAHSSPLLRDIKNTRKKSSQHQNARFEREEEEEEEEERGKEGKQERVHLLFFFWKQRIIHSLVSRISTTVNRTTVEMYGKLFYYYYIQNERELKEIRIDR